MTGKIEAYCVKCKTKRTMQNPEAVYTATGSPGTRGTCEVCGTSLFRMGATEAHAHLPKPEVAPRAKATASKTTTKKTTKTSSRKTAKTSASGVKATRTAGSTSKTTKTAKTAPKRSSKTAGDDAPVRSNGKVGKLVIVESPAKARSVGQFLGKGYTVRASKGHVRDLLVSQISVDVKNDFEPKYRVMNDKRDVVKDLKTAAQSAEEIYLATDPDREGEAIAWHLLHAADIDEHKTKRVVFHEITKPAIQEAFDHPRDIDMSLVNAQQARRILDRLVGYNITELLWSKVRNRLSAGRVQSIAVRLIVDREREVEAFVPREYWTLDAELKKHTGKGVRPFIARLMKIGNDDVDFGQQSDVTPHLDILERSSYEVADVKTGERVRKPMAPYTTSTLQQEASRRLGFTAKRTMAVAQQLYEGIDIGEDGSIGLITYMRTDSLHVSPQAQAEAQGFIRQRYGKEYAPSRPPQYKTTAKGAQEAHEAIRPTSILREPERVRKALSSDQYKLYNLIWQRFVASQMANAVYNTLRVDIDAGPKPKDKPYHFRVSGSTIKFMGFLVLYEETRDEDLALDADDGRILPELTVGEVLDLIRLLPEQHFTQPPPRYTEASLVRALEELGIGRPSTYAPTVAVIQDREYVAKHDKRLVPTETGRIVNDLLVEHFPDVMDFQFTARMENNLDEVSEGKLQWQPMLGDFYWPFEGRLQKARKAIPDNQQQEEIGRDCPICGKPLVIRYGRFGKFVGCSDYPECKHTEPLLERMNIPCPVCATAHGGELVIRRSRRGRTFYGCSRYPECDFTSWKKPVPQPCPNCGGLLVEQSKNKVQCINCEHSYRLEELPPVEETVQAV
jgi:DNA topoisomerase-1